jgi:hypothetical protein
LVREATVGEWLFAEGSGAICKDSSGVNNDLTLHGAPSWIAVKGFDGAVSFDRETQHLETARPVLTTVKSFSVALWVRLERARLPNGLAMEPDEYAWTAASQDSPTHSPFYLGVRKFPIGPDGPSGGYAPRWNITLAPVDGSVTGTLEWRHASSACEITMEMLDRWYMLVGVCDVPARTVRLYVPGLSQGESQAPEEWPFWQADGGLQIGRARWLGRFVDPWPGSIGPIRAYDRALSEADAQALYEATKPG